MTKHNNLLLGSASALTLALAIAGQPAHAAEVLLQTRTGPAGITADGQFTLNNTQPLTGGIISATATNNTQSNTQQDPGAGSNNATLGTNLIGAFAAGNVGNNGIPIGVGTNVDAAGIALANTQSSNATTVVSSATSNQFTMSATNFQGGTLSNTNNLITAQTRFNQANNAVYGAVPQTFANTAPGAISFPSGGNALDARGGVVVTNAQTNTAPGAGSGATLGTLVGGAGTANAITLTIDNTAGPTAFTANPLLQNNTLSAIFQGNSLSQDATTTRPGGNTVRFDATGGTSLGASVAVVNTQQNSGFSTTNGANNYDSVVAATIQGPSTLSGSLIVSGNTISAATTGNNAALPATGVATGGNVISVADGVSIAGPALPAAGADGAASNTIGGSNSVAPTGTVNANLAVLNAQLNDDTGAAGTAGFSTTTRNGQITATTRGVNNATVALTGNAVTAATQGNQAYNAIQAGGANTASITGPAALASVQTNSGLTMLSVNTGGLVSASVATTAGDALTNSPVRVDANTIGATTYGNAVGNVLSLTAANLADAGGAATTASATSNRTGTGTSTVTGTATLNTVQSNLGAQAVSATTTAPQVQLTAGNAATASTGANLSTSANTLSAVAAANSGQSVLTLGQQTGTTLTGTGTATGSLVNQQTNQAPVTGQLTNPSVTLAAAGASFTNPTIAASNNVLRALGYGNQAQNTVSEAVGTFSAGAPGGIAFSTASGSPVANGALVLLSDQQTTGNVTANAQQTVGPAVSVALTGANGAAAAVTGGTVNADGNALVGAARGNSATNTLTLASNSLTGAPTAGGAPAIASLGNLQSANAVDIVGVAATPGPAVSVTVGNLSGSVVSASNNAVTALATGSEATNVLDAFAGTITAASNIPTSAERDTSTRTTAPFALTNRQLSNAGGNRTATVAGSGVGIAVGTVGDAGTGSSVTGDGNRMQALATDNTAGNTLAIGRSRLADGTINPATALLGAGALNNVQTSTATATALVGTTDVPTGVGLTTGATVTGSSLSLSGNVVRAAAAANAATNSLTAAANTATGTGASNIGYGSTLAITQGDLALASVQTASQAVNATTNALLAMSGPAGGAAPALTASSLTMSSNLLTATADANTATNTLTGFGGASLGTTAAPFGFALANVQNSTAAVNATLQTAGVNAVTGTVVGSSVDLTGNSAIAQARGNTATNAVTADSLNLVGALGSANVQNKSGAVTSTVGSTAAPATVSLTTGAVTGSSVSVSGNVFRATSVANAATDTVAVTVTNAAGILGGPAFASFTSNFAGDAAQANAQTASGSVTATTNALLAVSGPAGGAAPALGTSSVSMSGNLITATADANTATNAVTSTAGANLGSTAPATFGTALLSSQGSTSVVNATVQTAGATIAAGALTGSTVDLIGNSAVAQARGNTVTNTASASAGATLDGNIALASRQTNGGTVTAAGTMTLTFADVTAANSTATMTGNTAAALAGGNTATNRIAANAGTLYQGGLSNTARAASGDNTTTGIATNSATPGNVTGLSATAQYALLSAQSNTANISATETNTTMTLASSVPGALAGQTTQSTFINAGNTIRAAAYANSAGNTIALNALPAASTTAALVNQQANSANVTASVTGGQIGVSAYGLSGGNTLGVTNNQILAQATGNIANNTISSLPRAVR